MLETVGVVAFVQCIEVMNMNVFVLNTGRCGSTTFSKACQHVSNFTSQHESRVGLLGDARLIIQIIISKRIIDFLGF